MSDGAFFGYIALLFASAVLLSVLAIRGFGQATLARVFDGILAVAFLVYAVYLLLFFQGGNVRIFIYAFLVPVMAVVQVVRHRKAQRAAAAAQASVGYAQPGHPVQFAPPVQAGPSAPMAQPGAGSPPHQ